MKIIQETPSSMVLKESNVVVTLLFGALFTIAGFSFIFSPKIFIETPPMWASLIFIVLGLITIFALKITKITLDKTLNKFSLETLRLTGKKHQEYDLDQIGKVQLQQVSGQIYSQGRFRTQVSTRLVAILTTGEEITLNKDSSSISIGPFGFSLSSSRQNGVRIANFLGIPFEELKPPSVGEVLTKISEAVGQEIKKPQETEDITSA